MTGHQERLLKGQFFSPAALCDLMLALCAPPAGARLLDPGCGHAIFLRQAADYYSRKFNLELETLLLPEGKVTEHLPELYGIDLDTEALKQARPQFGTLPPGRVHLIHGNFLSSDSDALGKFDCIIGNPPYVRQEHWRQSELQDKTASAAYLQTGYADYLETHPEQKILFGQSADLYLWFFLQAQLLLKPGGRLCFVTSNSWLAADFGKPFRRFLLDHFHIKALLESTCERWFPEAAINPLVILLEKKNPGAASAGETRMVRLTQPMAHWMPDPDQPAYWDELSQKLSALPAVSVPEASLQQYPRRWTLALRAPKPLTDLLLEPKAQVPLSALGTVRYPVKTGINDFFYLTLEQAAQWHIEPEFLFPVVKSARRVKNYGISPEEASLLLFSCPLDKKELQAQDKTGALAYIEWGETRQAAPRQKRMQPVFYPEVASVKNRRPWTNVPLLTPPDVLCNRFIDQRFFFALCEGNVLEDQTFYGLLLKNPAERALIAALLNSTLSCFQLEFAARSNLGEGVLQFARSDMAAFTVPDPALYSDLEKERIAEAFNCLRERPVLIAPEEAGQADRAELDRAVLAPWLRAIQADWSPDDFRAALNEAWLSRLRERRLMAKKKATCVAR